MNFEKTAHTNRQLNSQNGNCHSSIDWIAGRVVTADIQRLAEFIEGTTRAEWVHYPDTKTKHGKSFDGYSQSVAGDRMYYSLNGGAFEVHFEICGKSCQNAGTQSCAWLIRGLGSAFEANFTRIDTKIRVPDRIMSPERLEALTMQYKFTNVRSKPSGAWSHAYAVRNGQKVDVRCNTVYVGSRNSDKLTRCYNPLAKHGVDRMTDLEVVHRRDFARAVADIIQDLPRGVPKEDLGLVLATLTVSHFDVLIDKGTEKNNERLERAEEWQAFLNWLDTAPIKLVKKSRSSSLEKSIAWVERQVAGTLSLIYDYWGWRRYNAWMQSLREKSTLRRTCYQDVLLADALRMLEAQTA